MSKSKRMGGWKTWTSGALYTASGLAKLASFFFPEMGLDAIAIGLATLATAFGVVGIGHKLEKNGKE